MTHEPPNKDYLWCGRRRIYSKETIL